MRRPLIITILLLAALTAGAFAWLRRDRWLARGAPAVVSPTQQPETQPLAAAPPATTQPAQPILDPLKFEVSKIDPAVAAAISKAQAEAVISPSSAAAWGKLGMVLLAHDEFDFAEPAFRRAIQLDPKDPRWPYFAGRCNLKLDTNKAVADFTASMELVEPEVDMPRLRLVEALIELEKFDQADRVLAPLLSGQRLNARAHIDAARIALSRQNYPLCIQHLQRAASNPSQQKVAYQMMSEAHRRLGQTTESDFYIQRANESSDPSWPDPWSREMTAMQTGLKPKLSRADRLYGQNKIDESIALLRETLKEYPDSDWALIFLGRALIRQRKLDEAQVALRRAIEITPHAVEAHFRIGVSYYLQKRYPEAIAHFRTSIEHKPDLSLSYYNMGLCFRETGDIPGMIQAMRGAIEADPNHFESYFYLGDGLAQQGKIDEAKKHLQRAAQLNPKDPNAPRRLAEIARAEAAGGK